MTSAKDQIACLLWGGIDPFLFFTPTMSDLDMQGWRSSHKYLTQVVRDVRPRFVAEVGVWKGGSTITMAKQLKLDNIDGVIISIDTWLGSVEHWVNPRWKASLKQSPGDSPMMKTFMTNVMACSLQDYIIPFQLDSVNAALTLQQLGLILDCIHIDAGHDYSSVSTDIRLWWDLLRPGGAMILDDFIVPTEEKPRQIWPDVKRAVDEHAANYNLAIKHSQGKCWLVKPEHSKLVT